MRLEPAMAQASHESVRQRYLGQARYRCLLAQLHLHSLAGNDRQHSIQQINAWLQP